jgi:hypothetical protein
VKKNLSDEEIDRIMKIIPADKKTSFDKNYFESLFLTLVS